MLNDTAQATQCTAVKSLGSFCDRDSLPDAPFPICLEHAAQVLRYLNSVMPSEGRALAAARKFERESEPEAEPLPSIPMPDEDFPIIYYLRVGEHIKIGYSANFTVRRRFYPPDSELLAIEPGDKTLELHRLRQFGSHLSMRREWFTPSRELLAHIEDLNARRLAS